ncbi:MAG TPA: DUF4837 family protein [Bacteroidetes bacterium]|nr:DUF4837 family protein [Bacteroidota bacterium]
MRNRTRGVPRGVAVVLAAAWLLAAAGCGVLKRNAVEGDHLVAVVMEGSHAGVIEPLLTRALERPLFTPQPETRFTLRRVPDDSIAEVARWQNIILVGALDSPDPASERVRRMLKGDVLAGVESGEYNVFRKRDVWARGQTVIVLVAATRAKLAAWVDTSGGEIYRLLSEDRDERMRRHLYGSHEPVALSDSLQKAHGWRLRIAHDYGLVASSRSPEYIRLRRRFPDRFITVAWRIGGPEEVTADTLLAWRNRIGRRFADPVRVNPVLLDIRTTTFNGLPAVEAHGLWETLGSLGGGPFVAYLFHSKGTLYLLDGAVFAPDRPKELFIRQLEVILHNFEPAAG